MSAGKRGTKRRLDNSAELQKPRKQYAKPNRTSLACFHCWKSKTKCDADRPCKRCRRKNILSCMDRPKNPRVFRLAIEAQKAGCVPAQGGNSNAVGPATSFPNAAQLSPTAKQESSGIDAQSLSPIANVGETHAQFQSHPFFHDSNGQPSQDWSYPSTLAAAPPCLQYQRGPNAVGHCLPPSGCHFYQPTGGRHAAQQLALDEQNRTHPQLDSSKSHVNSAVNHVMAVHQQQPQSFDGYVATSDGGSYSAGGVRFAPSPIAGYAENMAPPAIHLPNPHYNFCDATNGMNITNSGSTDAHLTQFHAPNTDYPAHSHLFQHIPFSDFNGCCAVAQGHVKLEPQYAQF